MSHSEAQQVFSSITGFEASWEPMGAEAEGWEKIETVEQLENYIAFEYDLDDEGKDQVLKSLHSFRDNESGYGSDFDAIFDSLA